VLLLLLLPAAWSLTFAAIGGGGRTGESKIAIDLEARSLGLVVAARREGFSSIVGKLLSFRFCFLALFSLFFLLKPFYFY